MVCPILDKVIRVKCMYKSCVYEFVGIASGCKKKATFFYLCETLIITEISSNPVFIN
jgi:hypothetical protein